MMVPLLFFIAGSALGFFLGAVMMSKSLSGGRK